MAEKKVIASGHDHASFLESLNKIDDKVNPRSFKKSQDREENWVIKRYFILLIQAGITSYPISIVKEESPDFLIAEGLDYYGIEVTQSTSEDYQILLNLPAKDHSEFFDPTEIRYDKSKLQRGKSDVDEKRRYTQQEIRKLLHKDVGALLNTPARMGGLHVDASRWATDAIEAKLKVIRGWPLEKTKTTRILLYENSPDPIFDPTHFKLLLKEKSLEVFAKESIDPKTTPVDCLLGDGRNLIFDALISSELISNS